MARPIGDLPAFHRVTPAVALTAPFAHPYVRRGAERYVHDLARWLLDHDHEVTIVATCPDASRITTDESGVPLQLQHAGRPFGRGPLRVDEYLRTVVPVARAVRRLDVEVAQCHHYADAVGLTLGRVGRPVPYVFWLPGVPQRSSLAGRPLHRPAFAVACRRAARILALSRYAANAFRNEFGMVAEVLPAGVRTDLYAGPRTSGAEPLVLCTSAAEEPRKQVDLLVGAFPRLLRLRPDARLVLAPPKPDAARTLVERLEPSVRARAEVRDVHDDATLAALYREASVAVLPSVHEAFGLVIAEALAAGTPVVGADHGAIPELIDDPRIGRLFPAGDADALARAIAEVIELGEDPATPDGCRSAAARWDWALVGPQLENLYASVAA